MELSTTTLKLFADSSSELEASRWADQLGLGLHLVSDRRRELLAAMAGDAWALWFDQDGLGLQVNEKPLPAPVRADFVAGAIRWRTQPGRGAAGEMVARACGVRRGATPRVLDATAGLGRDAWILASLGSSVQLCERSPIIAALLASGLARARVVIDVADTANRMELMAADAHAVLAELSATPAAKRPEVVYLDPMFPHREKSALVKLDMRVFRQVVGEDNDADGLLALARQVATKRVVVKRPRLAPDLAGVEPHERLLGQSSRFDLYTPAQQSV
ncbi:MAG: class I SAM-dependent methyltransferase [Moraxellaceae bacterium]|nr:class I SAM-dependent methyltransferase [Moraxellaceae bacterium]